MKKRVNNKHFTLASSSLSLGGLSALHAHTACSIRFFLFLHFSQPHTMGKSTLECFAASEIAIKINTHGKRCVVSDQNLVAWDILGEAEGEDSG